MAIGRQQRRTAREARAIQAFGVATSTHVLDLLELVELSWHDCYGDITPPEDIIDDILFVADGDLGRLISTARLAVADWRDLRVAADEQRSRS